MDCHSLRPIWLYIQQTPYTGLESPLWHHSLEEQSDAWWQTDYSGTLCDEKGTLFSLVYRHLLTFGFAFPARNATAKFTIQDAL
jgi:hypothetical protein